MYPNLLRVLMHELSPIRSSLSWKHVIVNQSNIYKFQGNLYLFIQYQRDLDSGRTEKFKSQTFFIFVESVEKNERKGEKKGR